MAGAAIRTNHIGFTVRNVDRAAAMFADVFGYEVASRGGRHPRGVALLTGLDEADILVVHLHHAELIAIELISYSKPADAGRMTGRPCDVGYTHLTFDVRDIDAMIDAGARHGLMPVGRIVETAPNGAGRRVVYLRDDNGVTLELIQPAQDRPTAEHTLLR